MSQSIETQLQDYLAQVKPTLVEFYNPTCPRCQAMAPVIDELRQRVGDKANILQIDESANKDLMAKYHVHSHPVYILFIDGQEAWRDGGVKPLSELEDMVHRFE